MVPLRGGGTRVCVMCVCVCVYVGVGVGVGLLLVRERVFARVRECALFFGGVLVLSRAHAGC